MEQLSIFTNTDTNELPMHACVFTGHRHIESGFVKSKLKKAVEFMIKNGARDFYNGMAIGFDLLAAETVLSVKKKYPHVRLIACIPCYGQDKYFSETDKKRYVSILKKADEQVILADHYFNGCMQLRDQYMVERAARMIAYCKKNEGGAAYTVRLFQKRYPMSEILFL